MTVPTDATAKAASMPRSTIRLKAYMVPALLIAGLILRLVFMWFGAKIYYKGGDIYSNYDTHSFVLSFLNLWKHGFYSFNPLNPDAAFGRLPGYPFFWGGHYLLFGEKHVFQAVAYSQCLLDTVAIYLVYSTAKALTRDSRAAWLSGLIYAFYPFVLIWLTISGSEALATFMTLLVLWWITTHPVTSRNILIAGLLVGFSLMIREYLGVLLLSVFFWIFSAKGIGRQFISLSTVATVGFLLVYISWPIRNYVFQHRFMLLKPATAGYDQYAEDVSTARQWVYGWTPHADPYLDGIAGKIALPEFPADVFAAPAEAVRAQRLFQRARQCGTGFYFWRYGHRYEQATNCNAELAAGFNALNESYKRHHPVRYWTRVPLLNLQRAVFKNELRLGGGSKVITLLFSYRSMLILLSLIGAILLRRQSLTWPILLFYGSIYLFLCFGIRHLEIRYLLQADAAMLCLTGIPLIWLWDRFNSSRKYVVSR